MEEFLRTHGMAELRPERELKRSDRGQILLLRHPDSHQRFIFRVHNSSPDVYEKLLGLSCPHLPNILAVSQRNGQVLILEEYIPGDSLAFLLEGGTLTIAQTRSIAVDICKALIVLHKLGVVHRDIKPENILLCGDHAVLIDFDASRTYKENTTGDTHILGTTGYAAPEQYGFSQTDARADIYSMGILLNEMLTGKHPSIKLADGILRSVIEKSIAVNADMRYSSAAELAAALEHSATPHSKTRCFSLLATGLLTAAALVFTLRPSPAPESPSPPSPTAVSAENSATPEPPRAAENVSQKLLFDTVPLWDRERPPAYTTFLYDLDGDGIDEEYIFGMVIDHKDSMPEEGTVGFYLYDLTTAASIHMAPCVWQQSESTGEYERVDAFASLLSEGTITLWCIERSGAAAPTLQPDSRLFSVWPNAFRSDFTLENTGLWMYEVTAVLNGETLTGNLQVSIAVSEHLAPATFAE